MTNRLLCYCLLAMSLLSSQVNGQVTIANGLPGCLDNLITLTPVCPDNPGAAPVFTFDGSQIIAQRTVGQNCCGGGGGGDNTSYFEIGPIDISGYSNVAISMNYSAANTDYENDFPAGPNFGCNGLPTDNSHDQIVFYHLINGAPINLNNYDLYVPGPTPTSTNVNASFYTGTYNETGINGNTLTIRVYTANKASAEIFFFSNLVITGTPNGISAGPDANVCFPNIANLNGTGQGTWSGGAGTIANPNSAVTTYTPAATEQGTNVTLTYTGRPASATCAGPFPPPSDNMVVTVRQKPVGNPAGPLNSCNSFNLTTLNNTISGGTGTVSWFTDPPATIQIPNPGNYTPPNSTTVYAVIILNGCPSDPIPVQLILDAGPTGSLSGSGTLCAGQCTTLSFGLTGGSGVYDIDLSLTISPFPNFNFPIAGLTAGDVLTICYEGNFPTFNPSTNTVNIPTLVTGSATISLVTISDLITGCQGTVTQPANFSITLLPSPTANNAPNLQACDTGNGTATFDLSGQSATILGSQGGTVLYFSDPGLTMPIMNPYTGPSRTIYAVVQSANGCRSMPINFQVQVTPGGNAGNVSINCGNGQSNCFICNGSSGDQIITIFFSFPTNESYEVTMNTLVNGVPGTYTNTFTGPTGSATFLVNSFSQFSLESVTRAGDCPDDTDLGADVIIDVVDQPSLVDLDDVQNCGTYILPNITGTNLTGNEAYYTGPGGTGTALFPGDEVLTTTQFYIYDGGPGCFDEDPFLVVTSPITVYDDILDDTSCSTYILPSILGENVGPNAAYYTAPNGGGTAYPVGSTLPIGTYELYVFDTNNACQDNFPTFVVEVIDGPSFTLPNTLSGCNFVVLPPLTGIDLTGNQSYQGFVNGNPVTLMAGDTIRTSQTVTATDDNGVCVLNYPIQINIDVTPVAGLNSATTFCNQSDTLILSSILDGDPSTNGIWNSTNPAVQILENDTIFLNTLLLGTYELSYIVDGGLCGMDTSVHQLQLIPQPTAGLPGSFARCASDLTAVDLSMFLSGASPDGVWTNINMPSFEITDPSNVDLSEFEGMTLVLSYSFEASFYCEASSTEISIDIASFNEAGNDNTTSVCAGSTLDLQNLVVGADALGTFLDANGAEVAGGIFNTAGLPEGAYTFMHVINNVAPCVADTADYTIQVVNAVSAGDDVADRILCDQMTVDLNSILGANADLGGSYSITAGAGSIAGNFFTPSAAGPVSISYTVGDGILCPIDVSNLNLIVNPIPEVDLSIDNSIFCGGNEIVGNILYNFLPDFSIRLVIQNEAAINGTGPSGVFNIRTDQNAPNGTVNFAYGEDDLPFDLTPGDYVISITSIQKDNCIYGFFEQTVLNFTIAEPATTNLTPAICPDESVIVGSTVFNSGNPTGQVILQTFNGCDSIVNVALTILQNPSSNLNPAVCTGGSFTIGGTTFNQANPTGTVVLTNAALNGCDSLINVSLQFLQPTTNSITSRLCPGESLIIGGTTFDVNNPSGTITLPGANVAGCDSIINVALSFGSSSTGTFTVQTCDPNYAVTIGGTVFNQSNPTGQVTLPGANISGCDSIVNVDLTFGLLVVEETINNPICPGETGEIVINSIQGTGPFFLTLNSNLPFEVETLPITIPVGFGPNRVTVIADDGCVDLTEFSIQPVQDINVAVQVTKLGTNSYRLNVNSSEPLQNISWTPSAGLSCADCLTPTAIPGTYTINFEYRDGCVGSRTVVLELEEVVDIFVPNIFQPSVGGVNSTFGITASPGFDPTIVAFRVFDRWGNAVFQAENFSTVTSNQVWNGSFGGSEVVPGVYVYIINYSDPENPNRPLTKTGSVTVIR